jgi:CRP-like cAMP-binding protein
MVDDLDFLGFFRNEGGAQALAPGDVLFEKGEPSGTMYVVLSGELQIVDGNQVYETVVTGGIVGEMALVDGGPRSATVRARTASEVIAVDEGRFTAIVRQNPFFALRLMRLMSGRLRAMNERLRRL